MGALGTERGKKEAHRPLSRLSHSDIEATSRRDKPRAVPAERNISNTSCPINSCSPLREI